MAIMETLMAETPPLYSTDEGVVRIIGTRVSLDTVLGAFLNGSTAEQIAYKYPSLKLADIYAVITYYLRHRQAVESYLAEQHQEAESIRQEVEDRFSPAGVRERLLARRVERS
ncbi:MAG: DUF433 domain-containing protein [Deltaproteobacteria bacterium]|nr:DUF433 domain-containing protein [Deltaproteobacteria bacterium]